MTEMTEMTEMLPVGLYEIALLKEPRIGLPMPLGKKMGRRSRPEQLNGRPASPVHVEVVTCEGYP
jgi:hypothetical protein